MDGNQKKIAVYYIATGKYKVLFEEFLSSLNNFFPEYKKIVKLISDGLEEYKDYEKGNVKVDLCPRINNYPWPVITLYKMWNILENRDDSCDYACYFNGNAYVYPHTPNIFDMNKITTSFHSFDYKDEHYNIWEYINLSKESCAYLENNTYEYIQAAFFFGPSNLIYRMCQEVNNMVITDTQKYIFAQWHDESYLNKWCVDHPQLVDKKRILAYFKDLIDENRFVHLREKKDYNIVK